MIKRLLLALTIGAATAQAAHATPGTIRVAVSSIIDGNTIIVEQSGMPLEITLESIDAPELNQKFGMESKEFLSALLLDKKVTVDAVRTLEYRKISGVVHLEDLDINRKMISAGLAWYDERNGYNPLLKDVQKEAKNSKVGIWSEKSPIAPWVFRDGPKEAVKLPTLAVSYDENEDVIIDSQEGSSNNVKLDEILNVKVPQFTPPPKVDDKTTVQRNQKEKTK